MQVFTLEQKNAIEQLREALTKCREIKVMIAGLTDYNIFETVDSTTNPSSAYLN